MIASKLALIGSLIIGLFITKHAAGDTPLVVNKTCGCGKHHRTITKYKRWEDLESTGVKVYMFDCSCGSTLVKTFRDGQRSKGHKG